jgi:nucleotide-binding universal stress UspA family protein
MNPMSSFMRAILHPTDFSDLSGVALAHALKIALAAQSQLHLLHVSLADSGEAVAFPHVRHLLAQWGLCDEQDAPWVIADKLGIEVYNDHIKWQQPVQGIVGFLRQRPCDLIVLATHGVDGIEHWLRGGSVSEEVSRQASIPTLFIAPGARSFVSQITGDLSLRRALVPVDFSPAPTQAIRIAHQLGQLLTGADIGIDLMHVGHSAPPVRRTSAHAPALPPVMLRSGNVVTSIVDAAIELEADIIVMPTEGHRGVLDALLGSTTERVIRHSPCPVLAVPAA